MAKSARELFEKAMRLDARERAILIRLLIDTLDGEAEEGSEDGWRAEVEQRIAELNAGTVETVPWEELRARLYQR
jgi:putative addiction module component (TIGR02574 family)